MQTPPDMMIITKALYCWRYRVYNLHTLRRWFKHKSSFSSLSRPKLIWTHFLEFEIENRVIGLKDRKCLSKLVLMAIEKTSKTFRLKSWAPAKPFKREFKTTTTILTNGLKFSYLPNICLHKKTKPSKHFKSNNNNNKILHFISHQ